MAAAFVRSFCFSSKRHHVQTKKENFESPWISLEPVLSENDRWGHTQPLMWRYSYRLGRGKLGSPVHNSRTSKMVNVTRLCSGIIKAKWSRSSKVYYSWKRWYDPAKNWRHPKPDTYLLQRHYAITLAKYVMGQRRLIARTLTYWPEHTDHYERDVSWLFEIQCPVSQGYHRTKQNKLKGRWKTSQDEAKWTKTQVKVMIGRSKINVLFRPVMTFSCHRAKQNQLKHGWKSSQDKAKRN